MPINIDDIVRHYIDVATAHGRATIQGDYRTANKQYAILNKIYKNLEKDQALAENILAMLFQEDNASVRIWASAHALGLNIRIDDATNILSHYSKDQTIGILRLSAEMTLKEWEKKGKLKF